VTFPYFCSDAPIACPLFNLVRYDRDIYRSAPCALRGVMRPWFDCETFRIPPVIVISKTMPRAPLIQFFDFGAIYTVCLFISYASSLILFIHFFLTHFLPYLSFPLRIHPLRFQTGCRKRRLNLALVFLCLFCVLVVHFLSIGECVLLSC